MSENFTEHTSNVIMHFSLSHTLAVVSQEPLRSVPNFPEDRVQTVERRRGFGTVANSAVINPATVATPHLCFCDPAA